MTHLTLAFMYFHLCLFISATLYGGVLFNFKQTKRDYFINAASFSLGYFFAVPVLILVVIYHLLSKLWHWANNLFQIRFFYEFYFTKQYHDFNLTTLEKMNSIHSAYGKENTIHNRIYAKCLKMINKRNNYTYQK